MSRYEYKLGDTGKTVYIRRFDPFLGLEILGDLQQRFTTPFFSVLDGKQGASEEENRAKMMDALKKLSSTINGKELRALAETLIDPDYVAIADGRAEPVKLDVNEAFRQELTAADLLLICWAVVSYNFAEVLARLASPTGPAGALMKRANPSGNSGMNS